MVPSHPPLILYLLQILLLLIWLSGILWALLHWRAHPTVSLLVVIALLLLMGQMVIGESLTWQGALRQGDGRPLRYGWNLVRHLSQIVAWPLILIAIFTGRGREPDANKMTEDR